MTNLVYHPSIDQFKNHFVIKGANWIPNKTLLGHKTWRTIHSIEYSGWWNSITEYCSLAHQGDVWYTAALTTLKDYKDNAVYKVIYLVLMHGPLITESYILYFIWDKLRTQNTYGVGQTRIRQYVTQLTLSLSLHAAALDVRLSQAQEEQNLILNKLRTRNKSQYESECHMTNHKGSNVEGGDLIWLYNDAAGPSMGFLGGELSSGVMVGVNIASSESQMRHSRQLATKKYSIKHHFSGKLDLPL